jgi:hypothetical protein
MLPTQNYREKFIILKRCLKDAKHKMDDWYTEVLMYIDKLYTLIPAAGSAN